MTFKIIKKTKVTECINILLLLSRIASQCVTKLRKYIVIQRNYVSMLGATMSATIIITERITQNHPKALNSHF